MTQPNVITTEDAAAILGVTARRVTELIHEPHRNCNGEGCSACFETGRRLPAVKKAGMWLIFQDGLQLPGVGSRAPGRPKQLPDWLKVTKAGLRPLEHEDEEPPDFDQIETCRQWLRLYANRRQTFNDRAFSYSLKHTVERRFDHYISNGAFIQAAILEGYSCRQIRTSLNCLFNMSFPRKRSRLYEESRVGG